MEMDYFTLEESSGGECSYHWPDNVTSSVEEYQIIFLPLHIALSIGNIFGTTLLLAVFIFDKHLRLNPIRHLVSMIALCDMLHSYVTLYIVNYDKLTPACVLKDILRRFSNNGGVLWTSCLTLYACISTSKLGKRITDKWYLAISHTIIWTISLLTNLVPLIAGKIAYTSEDFLFGYDWCTILVTRTFVPATTHSSSECKSNFEEAAYSFICGFLVHFSCFVMSTICCAIFTINIILVNRKYRRYVTMRGETNENSEISSKELAKDNLWSALKLASLPLIVICTELPSWIFFLLTSSVPVQGGHFNAATLNRIYAVRLSSIFAPNLEGIVLFIIFGIFTKPVSSVWVRWLKTFRLMLCNNRKRTSNHSCSKKSTEHQKEALQSTIENNVDTTDDDETGSDF